MPKKAFAYLTTQAGGAGRQKSPACDADHIFDADTSVSMLLVEGEPFVQGGSNKPYPTALLPRPA
jgi:hypothetical protein